MEQHPVPRQITTFEFKLVGFMTLKQFIYLVVFIPLAYIVFNLFPVPILNFLLAAIVAAFGIALAFLPVNDRPLDVFIKNFLKRLSSPTQFFYKKTNAPVPFLAGDLKTGKAETHVEAKRKLADYLAQQEKSATAQQNFTALDQKTIAQDVPEPAAAPVPMPVPTEQPQAAEQPAVAVQSDVKKPYVDGVVRNAKKTPLSGILVYIKDEDGKPLRLLKTNPHGVFATYNPLPKGEYTFEAKDPKGQFFFDTMRKSLEGQNPEPIEFYSKEVL